MESIDVYKVMTSFRDLKWKGFFAEDHDSGLVVLTSDANYMTSHLWEERDRINYYGHRGEYHSYLDGYFGRPLVPADAYLLRRLYKRERDELEKEIDKIESNNQQCNTTL